VALMRGGSLLLLLVMLVGASCVATSPLGPPLPAPRPAATVTPDQTRQQRAEDLPRAIEDGSPDLLTTVTPDSAYRDDVDVRELYRNLFAYADMPLRYRGTLWTVVEQGDLLFVQVRVSFGSGPDDWRALVVMFPLYRFTIERARLTEGASVVVWGRPRTMLEFTDDAGNRVAQPLLLGDGITVLE
jgi:ketosteroid isomerase-like protein